MLCVWKYYTLAHADWTAKVEEFALPEPPPPPPVPPASIAIADYIDLVAGWHKEHMRPAIKEACADG